MNVAPDLDLDHIRALIKIGNELCGPRRGKVKLVFFSCIYQIENDLKDYLLIS